MSRALARRAEHVAPPAIAPVVLGCCHDQPRCLLCNPPPPWPNAETVAALVELTRHRVEEAGADRDVLLGFYGGPPPDDALLQGDVPFAVRVRPDLLTRAELARLQAHDLVSVELDALTLDDVVLRTVRRRYRGRLVLEQLEGLRARGLRTGLVLAPGLPATDFDAALRDARRVAPLVDFVRLHPVLVLDDAGLREAHTDGRYKPLDLGAAVTVCRAMLDIFDEAGVEVIRVGIQPGPDGAGRAVAGPRHSSLRELVESRRALDSLRALLDDAPLRAHIEIRCAPADETRTRGPGNQNLRTLRAERGLASVRITADPALSRGEWRADPVEHE